MAIKVETSPEQVQSLVARAQAGEEHAFDRLVDLYHDKIYNYVVRMVSDPSEAEDITQEAFVKAYRNLRSFRGAASFQTWLYRIANNLTIDSVRRRKRRDNTVSLDEPVEGEEGSLSRELEDAQTVGPGQSLETAELQHFVHEAIQELSPKLRAVVVMYELQGLSYEEIADILHCPLGTVKSRLFNARMELKDKLEGVLPQFHEGWREP